MLFLFVLETYLNSCIAVFLNTLNLSNYTRTSFDNSAWSVSYTHLDVYKRQDIMSITQSEINNITIV